MTFTFPTSPCRLLPTLLGALFLFGLPAALRAEAPMVKTQAPGYYRMMLGQFEVTALLDGCVELDAALFRNASEAKSRPSWPANSSKTPTKSPRRSTPI